MIWVNLFRYVHVEVERSETSFDDCKNNEIDSKIIYGLGLNKNSIMFPIIF